ncbi:MAG: DUF418 domain-containing protein [Flavobacteriaceae bacterium]|nr:DUF418 domain-containing protein [Flavobacteriaceae bacterium]
MVKNQRIIGIDLARAFAIIGMIVVNFKIVFGTHGPQWLKNIVGVLDGKAAATFVVLAGIGLALVSKKALASMAPLQIRNTKDSILKRAIFLFFLGISYISIWPADILHYYGIYMLLFLLLLEKKPWIIFNTAIILILLYPILMLLFNYEQGWDFERLEYIGFWQAEGFFRNLFYNGFHPVIPWAAFLLLGYWFGRYDLHNKAFIKKALKVSSGIFIGLQIISNTLVWFFSDGIAYKQNELEVLLGTDPMPPLPLYMFIGSSFAIAITCFCILMADKYASNGFTQALKHTGQLALTFYVAHVIVGMGIIEIFWPNRMGHFSLAFSLFYALFFSTICILFAMYWRSRYKRGPLEWLMREITG